MEVPSKLVDVEEEDEVMLPGFRFHPTDEELIGGSAGKGTKTDWMMHEFRLPFNTNSPQHYHAEVWTLCRIFRRIPSIRKYSPIMSPIPQNPNNNSFQSHPFPTLIDLETKPNPSLTLPYASFEPSFLYPSSFWNGIDGGGGGGGRDGGGGGGDIFTSGGWDELQLVVQMSPSTLFNI
ncbi:Transcription factor JUNGBRUNNEN 1, partial [Cucurbita argyrosperma subsp. sororia]